MSPSPDRVAEALRRLGFPVSQTPTLVAHGWESHVFECETASGRMAVRVHANPESSGARREAEVMQAVSETGYPVPSVYGLAEVDGHPALVMDFIDGPTLEHSGWPNEQVAAMCVRLMAELHAIAAPPTTDPLLWFREGTARIAKHRRQFAPYVSALWREEPRELRGSYCHLDFHPANVLWNGTPWVIDWTSGRITDPRLDFAWTRLLSAMYDPTWLQWLGTDEDEPWFEAAMALRRLATVAEMLATGVHAAGNDLGDQIEVMRVPADWLERGTGIPIPDVRALLLADG